MPQPVLVVGSSGLDTIETETETVKDVLGGSAIYFAAAASMFAPVRVVSVAGEDFPEEGRSGLARRDVDLAGLEVVPGGKTFRWAGRYSADMNERRTLLTELNVLGDFEPRLPGEYKATPYVFLANGPTATQHAVLDQLETKAYVAADTMNLWIDTERDELMRLLSRIDLLILNDEEARMISGSTALWDAAREITKLGPTTVALKKGEHGSYLVGRGGPCAVPSFPLGPRSSKPLRSQIAQQPETGEPSSIAVATGLAGSRRSRRTVLTESLVDPTGAGDSFAGAFMGYLAREESTGPETLRAALAVASVVASFTCESFGPRRLFDVTMDEVESRLETLRELVRF